jgi:hypothetical protein
MVNDILAAGPVDGTEKHSMSQPIAETTEASDTESGQSDPNLSADGVGSIDGNGKVTGTPLAAEFFTSKKQKTSKSKRGFWRLK